MDYKVTRDLGGLWATLNAGNDRCGPSRPVCLVCRVGTVQGYHMVQASMSFVVCQQVTSRAAAGHRVRGGMYGFTQDGPTMTEGAGPHM